MKIKCLDIRPHKIHLENVDFIIGDINKLPFNDDSVNNSQVHCRLLSI